MNRDFLLLTLKNWWFDASAKALAEGYRDYLFALNISGTVKDSPTYFLQPGDLAITDDGVHVMVYLGPDEWISADPGQGKVVIEHPSESKNPWFIRSVHFYRFSLLRNAEIRAGSRVEHQENAWQFFLKGSQDGCCLSTPDTFTKNTHWNVFISYGKEHCLYFLAERLTSQKSTGQFFCGWPNMKEREVALVCMERISGKDLSCYTGSDSEFNKLIADSKMFAAPHFYVLKKVFDNPKLLASAQEYMLSATGQEAKP